MSTRSFKGLLFLTAVCALAMGSCRKKETAPAAEKPTPTPAPQQATFPLQGHYLWQFHIPGMGEQKSHMTFHTDSVQYEMSGPAYSTSYVMTQTSYSDSAGQKRWIGLGKGGSISKDGVYFVMFLKDITDSSVTIYKRECSRGYSEAATFPYPDADATADYGWNMYLKK